MDDVARICGPDGVYQRDQRNTVKFCDEIDEKEIVAFFLTHNYSGFYREVVRTKNGNVCPLLMN